MIGQIVGNYKIEQKLGEGGMGAVYKGVDMMLEREVAIKFLRPELAGNPQVVERFRSEAVTLAKLNHPNIATLFNFLRQGDGYIMVLEFVRGVTLDHVIQQRGALTCDQAVPLFCQVLDGIQHAHEFGVIHRDIKPANMMLTEKGTLKVLDFGIARLLGTARMTRQGNVIGTIEYMSPEQVRGEETDARSDIYSLGMLLYEMLTGRIPFDMTNEFALMRAQIEQMPVPPRQINPAITEVVERAIWKAVAKNPDERFRSAGEFRSFLLSAGYAASGRLEPLASDASPYATRPISQPPPAGPPAGYATVPSQPGVSSHPGTPTPSQPGAPLPPSPGVAGGTDPLAATLMDAQTAENEPPVKETRLGTPGAFAAPAGAGGQLKETRLGTPPARPAHYAQPQPPAQQQPFAPPVAPRQESFFSKLTWVHYAGAGVAALVLVGVLVGVFVVLLANGGKKNTTEPTPANAVTGEPVRPAPQEQPPAVQESAAQGAPGSPTTPADTGTTVKPAQQPTELPVQLQPTAPSASQAKREESKPAAKAPQKPKGDSAAEAARKRREAALRALDQ